MSFGKAKRFNYKCPDLNISPADYYICSSLEKSCTISKSARFPLKKDDELSFLCSRKNCMCSKFKERNEDSSRHPGSSYRSGPSQASTPHKRTRNSTDLDKMKEKILILNQEDIQRFPYKNDVKSSADSISKVKNLVNKYENLPKALNFWTSEEFIDDDYHSYTSSDELDHFQKMDFFKDKEIRKFDDRGKFEHIIIKKMDNIRKLIENFQENLSELKEKVDRNENINRERTLQRCGKYSNSASGFRQDTSDDIKDIIFVAIENLRKKFESKQHSILSETIEKLKDLAKGVYIAKQNSGKQNKQISEKTASVLYNDIMDYIEKNDTLEFETSQNCDVVMDDESFEDIHHSPFNYENICQVLSDHLQVSQRELEDLKKEKTNVTIKCVDTQEKLKAQTSVINKLQEEIEELKRIC